MFTGMLHTHKLVVILFLLQYVIKTVLLFLNKQDALQTYSRKTRVPEMIVSTLFLLTGIYMSFNSGDTGTWLWAKIAAVFISIPLAIVAYKKMNKGLAFLSLLLLLYAYGVSETKSPDFRKPGRTNEFAGLPPDQLGRAIFDNKCMNCHGPEGKGGLSGSKDLAASTLSHEEKIHRIEEGKNAMMGYKKILSPEEIEAVAVYVESLK